MQTQKGEQRKVLTAISIQELVQLPLPKPPQNKLQEPKSTESIIVMSLENI